MRLFFGVGTQIISFFCRIFRSKTATPKLARFLSVQPLNRSFCCRTPKAPQSLMRSALPSAVNRRGKARQPLAFSCLFSYRLPISAKPGENRPKQRFAFAGLVFTRFVAVSRHTGRNTGSQGIKKDRRLFSYGQFNIKFYIVRFGLSSYGVCSSAMDIYSSSLCCSKPAIISANGARSPFTA